MTGRTPEEGKADRTGGAPRSGGPDHGAPAPDRVVRSEGRPWVEVWIGGDGPPVIAVPPAVGDVRTVWPTFACLRGSRRLIAWSLRGERGHRVGPDFGWRDLLEDLEEVYRVAGVGEAVLVGTSFGGALALRFTLEHPGRVRGLVLNVTSASPRGFARLRRLQKFLRRRAPVLERGMIHLYSFVACAPEILVQGPRKALADTVELARFARRYGTPGPVIARRIEMFLDQADEDLEARLGEIRCPTLVLSGSPGLDRMVFPESQAPLADRIPGAEHRIIEGTGHLGILTAPDRVCRAVLDWARTRTGV